MRSPLSFGLPSALCASLLVFTGSDNLDAQMRGSAASVHTADLIQEVRSFRQANETKILSDLIAFVSLPNFAGNKADIRRNAEYLTQQLEARGMSTQLLESPGSPPAVLGSLLASKNPETAKTVVFYAHYDGQSVDPSRWWSEPYKAQLRDGTGKDAKVIDLAALATSNGNIDPEWRLFGRSASDDKSPIVAMLQAIDALAQTNVPRSINLKFFFEGEEERGSPHLGDMLATHKGLLDADLWLFCDGPVHQSRRQQVVFGVRGVMGVGMTLYGPNRPLHSGHYGNWAPNPAARLAELIASMRDGEGKILIQGFYDKVRQLGAAELAAIREAPPIDADLRKDLDLAQSENNNAPLLQRILLPALNVKGLSAGMVGDQAKNAVPSIAQASIGFRLVPDLLPEDVRRLVEQHLVDLGYYIVYQEPTPEQRRTHAKLIYLQWENGYRSTQAPLNGAISEALLTVVDGIVAAQASIDGLQGSDPKRALRLPLLGGSLPLYLFEEILETPLVVLPMVNHDNNQHAPNENLRLQNLWDGIELYAGVIAELGKVWQH